MVRRFIAVLFCVLSIAAAAPADVIADWNAIASQTIAAGGRPGPSTLLDFAVVHVAVHDAVQSIERRYKPFHEYVPDASGSPASAAVSAAREVLVNRFPSQTTAITIAYDAYLAAHAMNPADPGVEVGRRAAAAIIALRSGDGSFPTVSTPFVGGTDPGEWRPTPPALASMAAPWLAEVTPFTVKSPSQFRAKRPPQLVSSEYAEAYEEVKALGALTGGTRTQEQTEIGLFWSDNTPLQWHRALRSVANAYVTDIGDSARLFALASVATADAVITCWDTKLAYNYWRPITAIHNAAEDGNPLTQPDPAWRPLLNTPPYSDYTSGANSVTAAMTRTMDLFFGTDEMTFSVTSNVSALAPDKRTRTFSRFSDAAAEVVEARIYLGYHFRFADTAAREQGTRIAKWVFTHTMKPVD